MSNSAILKGSIEVYHSRVLLSSHLPSALLLFPSSLPFLFFVTVYTVFFPISMLTILHYVFSVHRQPGFAKTVWCANMAM